MKRYLIIFQGRVQGVGFRFTLCQIAAKLNVTGYCQNLYTEDVRVEIQGSEEDIDKFLHQVLNNDNPWIKIEKYSLKSIGLVNNEKGFVTRY